MDKMNGAYITDISAKIEKIIDKFYSESVYNDDAEERQIKLENQKNTIFLSNGDVIKVEMPKSSLAHLLGVNTDYLMKTGMFSDNCSFDILKSFVSRAYDMYNKHKDGIINLNEVLSPYIDKKLDAFEKNIFMDINDCEFVCKYDKQRSYGVSDINCDMDYLIVQHVDDKYYFLSLVKKGYKFIPMSNQVYNNKEEAYSKLSDLIINQELTLMNYKKIKQGYGEEKPFWLNNVSKISKLNNLKQICDSFNCIPNVYSECVHSLSVLKDNKDINSSTSEALNKISDRMKKRKVIDLKNMKIKTESLTCDIMEMIHAYNDSLYLDNKDNDVSYSKIEIENQELKKKLEEKLKENEILKSENDDIKVKYEDVNSKYDTLDKNVKEAVKLLS